MTTLKLGLSRIAGIALTPTLAYFALVEGSTFAANALPFVAWLVAILSVMLAAAIESVRRKKPEAFAGIAVMLSPPWLRTLDIVVDIALIIGMAGHAWYWTAGALTVSMVFGMISRKSADEGAAAYQASVAVGFPPVDPNSPLGKVITAAARMNGIKRGTP
jgi:hypothetical protein